MPAKSVEQLLKETKIYQILRPKVVSAHQSITVKDALELMREMRSGYVVLTHKGKITGIFTENDVLNQILEHDVDWTKPAKTFISRSLITLKMNDSVGTAIDTMAKNFCYHIPLTDEEGDFRNVLSVRTLIRFLAEYFPSEVFNLPPRYGHFGSAQEGG